MSRMTGKVAIITGASSGIGLATLQRFAQEGATVVAAARTQTRLDEALASALALGGSGLAVVADVSGEAGCQNLIGSTIAEYGHIG